MSLLWFFREKVRAQELAEIGVTDRLVNCGFITVFRGSRCADEDFADNAGPCGRGYHDAGAYQWGDPKQDSGILRDKNGQEKVVFNSSDNWQLPPEIQSKLQAEWDKRNAFAVALTQSYSEQGLDIIAFPENGTLDLNSKSFEDGPTRTTFVHQTLADHKIIKALCRSGFTEIQVGNDRGLLQGYVGNTAQLPCQKQP